MAYLLIGILLVAFIGFICGICYQNWIWRDRESHIAQLEDELKSIKEENRDIMNLYAEEMPTSEEEDYSFNDEESIKRDFALERRIRYLYDKLGYDYNKDYYKDSLSDK